MKTGVRAGNPTPSLEHDLGQAAADGDERGHELQPLVDVFHLRVPRPRERPFRNHVNSDFGIT